MTIKAIETSYRGCRFRSRLEARWAVFFDSLNISWEYEKEGYDLGELGWYLPDFWLPELKCWFEVKGETPTDQERQKAFILSKYLRQALIIASGQMKYSIENVSLIYDKFFKIEIFAGNVYDLWEERSYSGCFQHYWQHFMSHQLLELGFALEDHPEIFDEESLKYFKYFKEKDDNGLLSEVDREENRALIVEMRRKILTKIDPGEYPDFKYGRWVNGINFSSYKSNIFLRLAEHILSTLDYENDELVNAFDNAIGARF
jgi:hypothetical protein